jgi:hypothetical protein
VDVGTTSSPGTLPDSASASDGMAQADLARSFRFPWGPEGTAYDWVSVYLTHDRDHARDLSDAAAPWWT